MSSELDALRDAARQVTEGLGLAADEGAAWTQIAELGWLLTVIPEARDGLGLGLPGACALHRELGRRVAPVPLVAALLSIDALCRSERFDDEDLLQSLAAGTDFISAPMGECALALGAGEALQVSGVAQALPSADNASRLLLWDASGSIVFQAPADASGLTLTHCATVDRSRRLFEARLDSVALADSDVLAFGEDARALQQHLLAWRDFAQGAEAVGTATALLDETIAYLGTRQQFGRPLAMFQSLKHRCADLKALVDAADALLQDALDRAAAQDESALLDESAQRAGLAVRQLAVEALSTVAEESLQLHGGIGMTDEHLCHHYLKRALLDEHLGRGQDGTSIALAAHLLAAG